MSYISMQYYVLLIITVFLYYLLPTRLRWLILWVSSCFFYVLISAANYMNLLLFFISIVISFFSGIFMEKKFQGSKWFLGASIFLIVIPLLNIKMNAIFHFYKNDAISLIVPG